MLKLVYACLAVTVIALAILIATAISEKSFFRGTTTEMMQALRDPGEVLDADAEGAVTQTGNGIVAGFRRDAEGSDWEIGFNRFPATRGWRNWDTQTDSAEVWCAGDCPSAIVAIHGNYSAHGGASPELADQLNKDRANVLNVHGSDSAFALLNGQLVHYKGRRKQELGADNASAIEIDESGRRAVVGSANAQRVLDQFELVGERWQKAAASARLNGLGNICISHDGRQIGAVAGSAYVGTFGSKELQRLGEPFERGRCQVDRLGGTYVLNPPDNPNQVVAVRFDRDRREKWRENLGLLRLVSPVGSPKIVVATPNNRLTALDAITGEQLPGELQLREPFVTGAGEVVESTRQGRPNWHNFGKSE